MFNRFKNFLPLFVLAALLLASGFSFANETERKPAVLAAQIRHTASIANDVGITNMRKKTVSKNLSVYSGSFYDKNNELVEIKLIAKYAGEPANKPLHLKAELSYPKRTLHFKERKVCQFDGAAYNPDDHAVYLLIVRVNAKSECADKDTEVLTITQRKQ